MSVAALSGFSVLYRSTIGRKVIMAVTGLVGIGFILGHMYGNLKVFSGMVYFDAYAEGLRELGAPVLGYGHGLFIARIVLLAAVVLHVWAAVTLTRDSWNARPQNYNDKKVLQANYASMTMRYGGIILFFFIIFHLMHFTWGTPGVHPDFEYGQAYQNLVIGFQSYFFIPALFYIVAVTALGFHIYHGTWSMLQTLGLNNRNYSMIIRAASLGLAVVTVLGFAVVPLGVMLGFVPDCSLSANANNAMCATTVAH